jgi:hypothetical protein
MQTTAMVAACRAVTVTDNGCEQVCSTSRPELVTVSMSGERPATWYRPGFSHTESFIPREVSDGVVSVRLPLIG